MLIEHEMDEEDDSDKALLSWAFGSPNERTFSTHIDSGLMEVNHRDHGGRTTLYCPAGYGNVDELPLLQAVEGMDIRDRDQDSPTPLAHTRSIAQHGTAKQLEDFLGLPFPSPSAQRESSL